MTFKEYQRKRFDEHIARLSKLIELNAPDLILALTTAQLIGAAEGAFGEALCDELLRSRQKVLRDQSGFCQSCDNRIDSRLTHPPICEHCNAREEKFCQDMENEIDKNHEEPE